MSTRTITNSTVHIHIGNSTPIKVMSQIYSDMDDLIDTSANAIIAVDLNAKNINPGTVEWTTLQAGYYHSIQAQDIAARTSPTHYLDNPQTYLKRTRRGRNYDLIIFNEHIKLLLRNIPNYI